VTVMRLYSAEVYGLPSSSIDPAHLVTGYRGHWSCTGPHCHGPMCRHILEVLDSIDKVDVFTIDDGRRVVQDQCAPFVRLATPADERMAL
jgi:hypothetical protein